MTVLSQFYSRSVVLRIMEEIEARKITITSWLQHPMACFRQRSIRLPTIFPSHVV
jgi:hypothetical protein